MFKFTFAGSSDFVLPILNSIYLHQGQNLSEVAQMQAKNLPLISLPPEFAQVWVQIPSNFWSLPLLNQKYELGLVITQPSRELRGKLIHNPVKTWALEHDLKVFTPDNLSDSTEVLKKERIDFGIVASYGQLLKKSILNTPNFGWINWHPSKLPLYRGPTPMQTALKNGDEQTALTWIEMGIKMDAGNMILQLDQEIEVLDGINSLAQKMGNLGAQTWAIATCLHFYEKTFPQFTFTVSQNPEDATFTKLLSKENSMIDYESLSAWQVFNSFRAYMNFPGVTFFSKYFDQDVKILELDLDYLKKASLEYKIKIEEILINSGMLENSNIYQEFYKQKNQVFLICAAQTLLPIKAIQLLKDNQKINLSGYNFK